MSGHSKFANIKHKKEKNDAAKGKIFTKIGRELAIAVKEGGSADPVNNSRLRDVIAKAKANNMPNDTIERNIKKAAGEGSADNYERITYEGYGPNLRISSKFIPGLIILFMYSIVFFAASCILVYDCFSICQNFSSSIGCING